ncbi:GntR family transcriptional regulator [Pseudoclavibacter helvolus]|uniref:DNA-binding GntR family transcriptional regulator n=1 Tax=Pseudoclavibacter helvolus TaxID=255205 RepID=A0A7W4URE1_9MICO|nr:GntR family transcriptional regulator [Pseudoclavibacter helvolus]MBB2958769.1 DNA-binding GntR family transcriptional regulator [Pseudoclavibacter helvolus]
MIAAVRPSPGAGRRDSVRQRVAAELRAALIGGDLAPGQVYSAPALAARFDSSATPVREAMLELARDGMVEVVPNTGFRVTEVTRAELDNLAEVRRLLEVPVMGDIAERHSDDDEARIRSLRPLVEAMERAEEANDMVTYLTADTDFHTAFLALHGNPELVQIVRRARERSRLHNLLPLAEAGQLTASTLEHRAMIDAALDRDRERMQELVARHIDHVRGEWAKGCIAAEPRGQTRPKIPGSRSSTHLRPTTGVFALPPLTATEVAKREP